MAKILNTTIHFGNSETGEVEVVPAGKPLTGARLREFQKQWGDRAAQFFTDDGEPDAPEQRPLGEQQPPADRVPDEPKTPQVEAAQKRAAEARAEANDATKEKTGQGGNAATAPKK